MIAQWEAGDGLVQNLNMQSSAGEEHASEIFAASRGNSASSF